MAVRERSESRQVLTNETRADIIGLSVRGIQSTINADNKYRVVGRDRTSPRDV
jgi:hypothetical protein